MEPKPLRSVLSGEPIKEPGCAPMPRGFYSEPKTIECEGCIEYDGTLGPDEPLPWENPEPMPEPDTETAPDVSRQSHYTDGSIQPIQYLQANLPHEMFEGFLVGNVIKYISRYRNKNGLEDLHKATVYLDWLKQHYNGLELTVNS